eukprot:6747821-Pyramimonas_sp.AAC.1
MTSNCAFLRAGSSSAPRRATPTLALQQSTPLRRQGAPEEKSEKKKTHTHAHARAHTTRASEVAGAGVRGVH